MIGRYRDTENGKPRERPGPDRARARFAGHGEFSGADELQQLLSTTEYVQQCFAVQASRFALGRDEAAADACSLKSAWDAFSAAASSTSASCWSRSPGTYAFSHRNNVNAGQACR